MKKLYFLVLLFTLKGFAYNIYINNHLDPKDNMQCEVSDWVTVGFCSIKNDNQYHSAP